MWFLLPYCKSETLLRQDRFDLLPSEDPEVPFWDILYAILKPKIASISALIDQLETISITLRGKAATDYGFLQTFLESDWPSKERLFTHVWPGVISLALEMPVLFPEGSLPVLSQDNPRVVLSRRQVACLVVHQFLCSLPAQPWVTDSSVDFSIWFSNHSPSPKITQAYLYALFTYFERLVDETRNGSSSAILECPIDEWPITFTLRSLDEDAAPFDEFYDTELLPLHIIRLDEASTDPAVLGLPSGACVISANKNVGFGSTGTQEETHVGSSPEACVAVLITPTLRDLEVLIVQGVEAMITINGYGRQARLGRILKADYNCSSISESMWRQRTMLFMDAIELDMYDATELIPDLLPGNVDRELRKAYTAFSYRASELGRYTEIYTGLWGCGAFGGNWQIKSIIQWCAASMAGVPLRFAVSGEVQREFADRLEVFTQAVMDRGWRVGTMSKFLTDVEPHSDIARDIFSCLEKDMRPVK
jgi:poly(ADP-ribose) glycohydrolase